MLIGLLASADPSSLMTLETVDLTEAAILTFGDMLDEFAAKCYCYSFYTRAYKLLRLLENYSYDQDRDHSHSALAD
jgi:hypothetical protein